MALNFREKILTADTFAPWRKLQRSLGKKVVVTNGCFDLLHLGHVSYLQDARNAGDLLLVGLNGDQGVRQLKGESRPLQPEADRAAILSALESVSAVMIFPEKSANNFLALAQPDIYVKGGDYTLETLNQEERHTVEEAGGRIVFIPFVPERSTTLLAQKIARL